MNKDMPITSRRVVKVLDNMRIMALKDESIAKMFSVALEHLLNEFNEGDDFGTEGQNDPRGDFRNGDWSMKRVEGVDD